MIALEKRPQASRVWVVGGPVLAVVLTMLAGGLMFAALGSDPIAAIRIIFWDPLFSAQFAGYSRPQLLVKAGPLILIAIGLSMGFKAGIWNIGAEGQYIRRRDLRRGVRTGVSGRRENPLIFPGMVLAGVLGGTLWAMIPALLKVYARTNEILVSLLLVYVAEAMLASAATGWLRNPEGSGFPGSRNLARNPGTDNPELIAGTGMHWGVAGGLRRGDRGLCDHDAACAGLPDQAGRAGTARGALRRRQPGAAGDLGASACRGRWRGPQGCSRWRGRRARISIDFNVGYGFTAIIVAFLGRLNPIGILLAGLLMALTFIGGEAGHS